MRNEFQIRKLALLLVGIREKVLEEWIYGKYIQSYRKRGVRYFFGGSGKDIFGEFFYGST